MATVPAARDTKALGWKGTKAGAAQVRAPTRRKPGLALALVACLLGAVAGRGMARAATVRAEAQAVARESAALVASAHATAESARRRAEAAEQRAANAEQHLAAASSLLGALEVVGAVQQQEDLQEAQRLGLVRALGRTADPLPPDDQRRILAAIIREARKNGLDPLLVAAVIQTESHFDPFAISQVGARGLMQLMPPTAQDLLPGKPPVKPTRLFNAQWNIELGTLYLAQLIRRFDGDVSRALVAYNAGPGTARALVRHSASWRKLQGYPRAVMQAWSQLKVAQHEQPELAIN